MEVGSTNSLNAFTLLNEKLPYFKQAAINCFSFLNSTDDWQNCVKNQIMTFNSAANVARNVLSLKIAPSVSHEAFTKLPYLAETVNNVAKSTLEATSNSFEPQSQIGNLLSKTFKYPFFFLPIIPCILWALYSSKETHINSVSLNITASPKRRLYEVSLIKNNTTMSTAFEITAGHPIRLLNASDSYSNTEISPTYISEFSESKSSLLNPFSAFKWKRKEIYTTINIIVKDNLNNAALNNGPLTYAMHFYDKGVIEIKHISDGFKHQTKENIKSELEALKISRLNTRNVNVHLDPDDHQGTYHIPLPHPNYLKDAACSEYLHIERM